ARSRVAALLPWSALGRPFAGESRTRGARLSRLRGRGSLGSDDGFESVGDLLEGAVDVARNRSDRLGLLLDRPHAEGDQAEGVGNLAQRRGDDDQVGSQDDDQDRQFEQSQHDQQRLHPFLLSASSPWRLTSSSSSTPSSLVPPSMWVVAVFCATRLPITQTSSTALSTSFTVRLSHSSRNQTTRATTSPTASEIHQ